MKAAMIFENALLELWYYEYELATRIDLKYHAPASLEVLISAKSWLNTNCTSS